MPVVILALDSSWIFGHVHRDVWIYYGYFHNAGDYAHRYADQYFSSRLSVIIPGFLAHRLFAPLPANVVLHLLLLWTASASFYGVARQLFGPRAALIAAITLTSHPYFLVAMGWNYVDGFGISYFLAALFLVSAATTRAGWRILLFGAGMCAVGIVSANVAYAVYVPFLIVHFLVLNRRGRRRPVGAAAAAAAAGTVTFYVLLGAVNALWGGPFHFLLTSLQFGAAHLRSANPFLDRTYGWLTHAVWLGLPVLVLVGTVGTLAQLTRRRSTGQAGWAIILTQLELIAFAVALGILHLVVGVPVLQYAFYASLLIPWVFLAGAGQLALLLDGVPVERPALVTAAILLVELLPFWLSPLPPWTLSWMGTLVAVPLLAGAGIALAPFCRAPSRWAVLPWILSFSLLHLVILSIPQDAESAGWPARNYSDPRGLFLQLHGAFSAINALGPPGQVRVWQGETVRGRSPSSSGDAVDAVAWSFLCAGILQEPPRFPTLASAVTCDQTLMGSGMSIALLSTRRAAPTEALAALASLGLSARLRTEHAIPGPLADLRITLLELEPTPGGDTWTITAAHPRLFSEVGQLNPDTGMRQSNGQRGWLVAGPYVRLPAGRFEVAWVGTVRAPGSGARVDVVHSFGTRVLAESPVDLRLPSAGRELSRLEFQLDAPTSALEFRFFVGDGTAVDFSHIRLRRQD